MRREWRDAAGLPGLIDSAQPEQTDQTASTPDDRQPAAQGYGHAVRRPVQVRLVTKRICLQSVLNPDLVSSKVTSGARRFRKNIKENQSHVAVGTKGRERRQKRQQETLMSVHRKRRE